MGKTEAMARGIYRLKFPNKNFDVLPADVQSAYFEDAKRLDLYLGECGFVVMDIAP